AAEAAAEAVARAVTVNVNVNGDGIGYTLLGAMALCWASVGALHALMTERRRGRVNRRSEGNKHGQPTSDAEMSAARLHAARRIQTRLRTLINVRHARNGSQRLPTRELDEADDMDL
ncbi:MAG: hypothetical protein ACK559_30520, partial [bacterium]